MPHLAVIRFFKDKVCHCLLDISDAKTERAMIESRNMLAQMALPVTNAFGKDVRPNYDPQITHLGAVTDDMQDRKMRCDELAEVRQLKLKQILQLRICEQDIEKVHISK